MQTYRNKYLSNFLLTGLTSTVTSPPIIWGKRNWLHKSQQSSVKVYKILPFICYFFPSFLGGVCVSVKGKDDDG